MIIFLLVLFVLFATAGAASAAVSENCTAASQADDGLELEESEIPEITASQATFTDLAAEIKNAQGELELTRDYTYSPDDSDYKGGITVDKVITINGNGFTINGNGDARAFYTASESVTLKNIRFVNCEASAGGAVYNFVRSSLTVENCEFTSNHASDRGGAVFNEGILKVTKSVFSTNKADDGGAVATKGKACSIESSVFDSNRAERYGGAVYAGTNNCTITGNIFSQNEAGKNGGAIHNGMMIGTPYTTTVYDRWGNAIVGSYEYYGIDTDITKNTFLYNRAVNGAAIDNTVSSVVTDSNTFYSNSASSASGETVSNDGANTIVSNNVYLSAGYPNTVSNSGSYSRITSNVFDDAPAKTPTIDGAGTSKADNGHNTPATKAAVKLAAKSKKFSVKVKTKKYSATLKTGSGEAVKNAKLTLKVNGKTYKAKTDDGGKATFKITKLKKKGTYSATVTFKGNADFTRVSKSVKIKCR